MQDRGLAAGPPPVAEGHAARPAQPARDPRRWAVFAAVYAMAALVFWFDVTADTPLAAGVLYVPLVLTASQFRNPRSVWLLGGVATGLAFVGYFLPEGGDSTVAIVNRSLSIGVILLTAFLVREQQKAAARLAATITRAEAAEAAKGQLLGNASHDFRNSLNAVLGFTELLKEDCLPAQRDALAAIEQGGRRLLDSVENLIDLTQLDEQGPRLSPVDLAPVLAESIVKARVSAQARSVAVIRDPPFDGIPPALADQWAVRRILDNLFQNAVKFSPIGARVRTRIRPEGGSVVVEIADEGCGIRPETVAELGQPVLSTEQRARHDADGLGIGLALAIRLARLTGGRLEFPSEPGRGTTARLSLPVAG